MRPIDPTLEGRIVTSLAAGMAMEDVARALNVSVSTVHKYAHQEENARVIAESRAKLRVSIMEVIAGSDEAPSPLLSLLKRLGQEAQGGSARDLDALARAAHALERIAGSAAGEQGRGRAERVVRHVVELAPFAGGEVVESVSERRTDVYETQPSEVRPALPAGEPPPAPKKTDGAPYVRQDQPGEDNHSRASGSSGVDTSTRVPALPHGTAGSDVEIPDDFEV